MRNYDLTPLYRATVGYDRMADMLDRLMATDTGATSYPPYNIEKVGDDAYRISIAVAGFAETDLGVEQRENALIVTARQEREDERDRAYLHRGIATRAFEKRFHLADHVRVTGAVVQDGMLHINLVREVPEALKPRQIEIQSGQAAATIGTGQQADAIEGQTSAA